MFGSIGRSWELAKDSFRVLRADKELLVFPLLSLVALVVVSISFLIPFMAVGGLSSAQNGQTNIASYVVAFLFYVVSYTVTFFFQTALVGAAMIRLDGGDPTIGDGLRIAFSLRKTWGEQIVGNVGIGLVFGLLIFLVIFAGGALCYFLFQASIGLGLAGVVALILLVAILALIASALSGIFTASVYRFATKGDGGAMFNNQVLSTAFRPKR